MAYTFEKYKEDLINFHYYPCDKDKTEERKALVERLGDDYLHELYDTAYEVALFLVKKIESEGKSFRGDVYTRASLDFDSTYIYTNCTGGYSPDKIIKLDEDGAPLTEFSYLALSTFLQGFRIYEDEEEITEEDDFGGVTYVYPILKVSTDEKNFAKTLDLLEGGKLGR